VAPFHPLPHEVRALAARALTALAVFLTIAMVLLAGSADGPIATAEASHRGDDDAGREWRAQDDDDDDDDWDSAPQGRGWDDDDDDDEGDDEDAALYTDSESND
jgi:hypothetical protein